MFRCQKKIYILGVQNAYNLQVGTDFVMIAMQDQSNYYSFPFVRAR